LILKKAEKERALSARGGAVVPIEVPQERLAAGPGAGIVLGPPE